jgi:glycosyltransferase involved in cell wall biosynthesis
MSEKPDALNITVLIPTYNRAEGLRETLDAMCQVERDGLVVEFVVIDNNSTDHTKDVVESFAGRLPIRYRFEPRPGKSCALNGVLDNEPLGDIVVLTDDDVSPCKYWLQAIHEACKRWPDHKVFGGKVPVLWPGGQAPSWWTVISRYGTWTLGGHDLGGKTGPYPPGLKPMGANTWVRREVLSVSRRFDESVGPRGGETKIMGQDGVFMNDLIRDGHEPIYYPDAVVYHRIQREKATPRGLRRRVWSQGRGAPHYGSACRPSLLVSHPILWGLLRIGALSFAMARYFQAMVHWSAAKRLGNSLPALGDIAYNLECLRIGGELRRQVIQGQIVEPEGVTRSLKF